MTPLNLGMIAVRYADVFKIPYEDGVHLANLTKGYPFAFQALGYSIWNYQREQEGNSAGRAEDNEEVQEKQQRCDTEGYMSMYRLLLEEYVYEKIWSELSSKDKQIVDGIAHCPGGRIRDINVYLGLKPNEINQYRKRLIRKGIVDGSEYGHLQFTLPLLEKFVLDQMIEQTKDERF